jgi:hypothetical protein
MNSSSSNTRSGMGRFHDGISSNTYINEPTTSFPPSNNIPKTCFDFIMYGDEDIKEYLNPENNINSDNLVIIDPNQTRGICSSRTYLENLLRDPSMRFYPCIRVPQGGFQFVRNKTLIRIHSNNFNVVVPITDVKKAMSGQNGNIFKLYKTDTEYEFTSGANAAYLIGREAYVSADHCQSGSNKTLYRLLPTSLDQLGGIKKQKYKYKGKFYKICKGTKGGKYIIVDKKRIYLKN